MLSGWMAGVHSTVVQAEQEQPEQPGSGIRVHLRHSSSATAVHVLERQRFLHVDKVLTGGLISLSIKMQQQQQQHVGIPSLVYTWS